MKSLKKYTIGLFSLLLLVGCADRTFEWISIKPEKINLAKEAVPASDEVRKVDLTFTLQEKAKEIYFDDANTYFGTQNLGTPVAEAAPFAPTENSLKRLVPRKTFIASKRATPTLTKSNVAKNAIVPEKKIETAKLNNALKFPKTVKPKLSSETTALRNETMHQMLDDKKKEEISSAKSKDESVTETKEKTADQTPKVKSAQEIRKGQSIMWVGLILIVLGGVLGFIFSKNAFYIAGAGLVFAIIGYFIKM